jgi:hypothetical protein
MKKKVVSTGRMKALAGVVLVLAAAALFACDEVYADPVTIPFTSSSSGFFDSGVSTSPRIPPIPCNSQPNVNGPCARAGAVCEYPKSRKEPGSPDPTCNSLLQCVSSTQFGASWTEQTRGSCLKCPDPQTIVNGAPCDLGADAGGDEAELQCIVPGLGNCGCTTGPDGAHAHPRRWVCVKPTSDCPAERPLLGQPCFGEHSCDYGACEFKRGAQMICQDEVWQVEVATCK